MYSHLACLFAVVLEAEAFPLKEGLVGVYVIAAIALSCRQNKQLKICRPVSLSLNPVEPGAQRLKSDLSVEVETWFF